MAKVYVSSTVADLERERQAVMDWLVAAQHQVVHSYRPNSDTVRDSCLEDVDTCDLYVLILGHRYGFQPPDNNPEHLSITHLEFRRAGETGSPRIALLRTSIPDVSRSDIADSQKWARVLQFREEVTGVVRAAEFGDLRGLIQELSTGIQAELEKIHAKGAKHLAASVSAARVLRLAPRPAFLAGREDLLADLDARLASGDSREPRVVVLHGLAGTGKTSVALTYAHRHPAKVGVMWQFAAENPAVLAAGFTELATALGEWEGAGDPVVAVHGVLAASPAEWLLLFDNAPSPRVVDAFLPPAGNGRVLITSRNALWPPGQAVEVPVLDPRVAADFLAARTGDTDRQAAEGLAEAVGGLPLALEQAAAYAQATGDSLAAYLALFHKRRADLLTRGQPAQYAGTVATTWILAFEQLQQDAPDAAALLRLLANCAPEAIPLPLLLQPRPGLTDRLAADVAPVLAPLLDDELRPKDAVEALRRYSLVRPAAEGLVSVHRLVQAVTLDQLSGELRNAWRQAAASMIEAAIPDDPRQPGTWPVYAALLPHAQTALAADSDGMIQIASYLGHSGNYAAARDLMQKIVTVQEQSGHAQHPRALAARASLAHWTGEAGGPAAACDLFAALVEVEERILAADHPATLSARDSLARWTGEAGNAATARDLFAALVEVEERVFGADHPATLSARDSLARWTGEAGGPAAARDLFAELLPIRERVLGPEDPQTLITRGNLAYWTGAAGEPAAACGLFAELLPIRVRVLGHEHPRTLSDRDGLARFTGEAGNPAAACDMFADLLPIRVRVLGPEHPQTLTTRGNIAHWTGEAGDAAAACGLFAALVRAREQVLGADHPDTLIARDDLARWTGEAGNAGAARDQLAGLLPVAERVLGPEHPQTLTARGSLAYWTGAAGNAAQARDEYAALVQVREQLLGADHLDTLTARESLARFTGEAGNAGAARDQLAGLLPVVEGVLGPEHPQTLTARGSLAYWTGAAGNAAEARDLFAELVATQKRVLAVDHPDTLTARDHLARLTGEAGDAAEARDQLAVLLLMVERTLGPVHPQTLATRGSLAYWTGAAGDAAAARDQYAALLPVRERLFGSQHPDTLTTRNDLAYWTKKTGAGVEPDVT